MKLIVGLGNYQKEYLQTRHNMGFMVIDELTASLDLSFKENFNALIAKYNGFNDTIYFAKPLTNMNLSGIAVKQIMDYYKIDTNDLLVISDDMDLVPGQIRLRKNGSSGHQKGLQNIMDNLKTENFKRIRIGIGRPKDKNNIDYVLGIPDKKDRELISEAIQNAADAIVSYLKKDFEYACSTYISHVE